LILVETGAESTENLETTSLSAARNPEAAGSNPAPASLAAAKNEFERFKQDWSRYPGAVSVWERNWLHVEQLFDLGSAVRRVMS